MFVSNKKKACFPTTISIDKNDIEVVDNFKLLGVIIHNRLNFLKNVFNHLNNLLNQYNIDCFQHRVIIRLSCFIYKIINYNSAPLGLKSILIRNLTVIDNNNLRNKNGTY